MTESLSNAVVMVEGLHCAGCIRKIESAFEKDPDIETARVNFSNHRLYLVWNGPQENVETYIKRVQNLGFGAYPFSPDEEVELKKAQQKRILLALAVAGFAMGNVMLISIALWITDADTMGEGTRQLLQWLSALIAVPAIFFSGQLFFQSAYKALSHKKTNMDVPISVALILTTAISLWGMFNHQEHIYFDSALMLMFFLLVGRYLDMRAQGQATQAATDILGHLNETYTVLNSDGDKKECRVSDLLPDMNIIIEAGRRFPVDGVIVDGESDADAALITGETLPINISKGTDIYAGTINLSAPVVFKVQKIADESVTEKIKTLLGRATKNKSTYMRIADRAAQIYTPLVHSLALVTFVFWLFYMKADWQTSLMIAVSVLIITCPCALGLAVPVVHVLAIGKLLKKGVILKSGDALERLQKITNIIFDKTGVLTTGQARLIGEYDPNVFKKAASLALHSHHPLSKALVKVYNGKTVRMTDIVEHPGKGIEGKYRGDTIRLGRKEWITPEVENSNTSVQTWFDDGAAQTPFYFSDSLRNNTTETIEYFKSQNIEISLLTGDKKNQANKIAAMSNIKDIHAEQLPEDKFNFIQSMSKQNKKTLMIGDGLNDTAALAAADVSMAPSSAVDLTQNTADIVFMGDSLEPVITTYKIAQHSQKMVKQNFALAVVYNVIAIPFAMAGFVTPVIAALAMSASSLIVIANSFRLNRIQL